MMTIKDWVLSQLVSKSLVAARPLSGSGSSISEGHIHDELGNQGPSQTPNSVSRPPPADTSLSSNSNQENQNHSPSQLIVVENSFHQSHCITDERKWGPLAKIETLQIKFLRLLRRFGHAHDNLMVSKVLYRLHLATLISAGEPDLKTAYLRSDKARAIAADQETAGVPELDFSFRVLVLGKTGVGKSSTINSIFDETKTMTDAFRAATDSVQEIVGTVNGIKVSFIDTPGLLPSATSTVRKNRKMLYSVKRFLRKHPPDMVLYFERLDMINTGYSDFPLLKLINEVFGSAIWFNTILVMTHSSSALPEGPNGFPVTYESYVTQCTNVVQHYIHLAVSDAKLENPVLLVENHPHCRTDISGEKILPNGQVWKSHFFLLCMCTKVLADVNSLLKFQDNIELGPLTSPRLPSLPHLFSSFLRHHISSPNGYDDDIYEISLLDSEEEDDYDELPPIRILTKSQFGKLSDSQKRLYLNELDYRETLYLKKQLKEETYRRKENQLSNGETFDNLEETPESVQLPDMAVPPSFDSDCPVHRYRCVVTNDQWLARPVLDLHGWDRDVGFDGINMEGATELQKNIFASVTGQMSKDKQDFSIQSECAASFVDPRGSTYDLGLDIQSSGKELIYTVHGNTKLRTLKHICTECGVSVTSFGDKCFVGAKLEDRILVGKRLKFVINGGWMGGLEQSAYGGSLGATLRGKDYPVRNDKVSLTMTVLSLKGDTVLGGSIQSDFRVGRGTKFSVNANLNSQNMGQVCIKASSSQHMEIALIAVVSIFRCLLRKKTIDDDLRRETLKTE